MLLQFLMLLVSCTKISVEREKRGFIQNKIAEEYYNAAMDALEQRDIARALVLLIKAHYRAPKDSIILDSLEGLIGSLESKAFYTKETIKKGMGLEHPLQYQVLYNYNGRTIPVGDIPVHYSFYKGNGILTEGAITDNYGIAKCYVEEVTHFENSLSIKAQVILTIEGKQFPIDALSQDYFFSTISFMDMPHSVVLFFESHSLSEDHKNIPSLCTRIVNLFRDNGFTNVECMQSIDPPLFQRTFEMDKPSLQIMGDRTGSDIIVLLWIKTSYLSQPSIDFFFSQAEVSTKIMNTQNSTILFQEVFTEEGAGSTQSEAEQQALSKALGRLTERIDIYLKRIRRENGV